jgi:DNA-directed RNA polymerase specialized sigma24 family protein
MDSERSREKAEITAESFALLLGALAVRREGNAAQEYEKLRQKLTRYFRAHSIDSAEELVDTVFDRVALKISADRNLDLSTNSYFLAVARFVLLEHVNGKRKRTVSLDDDNFNFEPAIDPLDLAEKLTARIQHELGLDAVAECTRRLTPEEMDILQTYDGGSGREKIERRNALAERLGKSKATLIVAISRIRSKIKECVRAKLAALPEFEAV